MRTTSKVTVSSACSTLLLALVAVVASAGPAAALLSDTPQVIRFHGGGYDDAGALAVDAAGNLYLAGSIEKSGSPITFAVTKLSPSGTVQWTSHYSGSRGGVGGSADAVTVDAAGNVYAAGLIGDGVIFNTNWDYLLVKLGPNGVERWAQRYDGPAQGFDRASEVAVDAAGGVYVSGFSYGQNHDWATLKFNPNGTLAWERRKTGSGAGDDRVADMALNPSGNLIIAGSTATGDGLTSDAEIVTYNPAGNVVWQRRWTDTATSHEAPRDLDIDAAGRIAVTGTTAENASPYVPSFPLTLRYDAAGNLLQTIRDVNAGGAAVDVDAAGNTYLAGTFFATPDASSVAKYDAAGTEVWSAPLTMGSSGAMNIVGVAADSRSAVTVAGSVVDIFTGQTDYLTIRYAPNGSELWRHRFAGAAAGQDQAAALAVATNDDALVTGTSWNDYLSIGGTADDMVTLRFAAGAIPTLHAPTSLQATALSADRVRLTWQDNSGVEDGFRIERCRGAGCTNFAEVAVVGHDVATYVDEGLTRLTTYCYRVRTFNPSGNSAYSNIDTVKTKRR